MGEITKTVTYTRYVDDVDGTESSEDKPGGIIQFVEPGGNRLVKIALVGGRYDEAFNLLDGLAPYAEPANPDELARGRARKPRSASGTPRATSGKRKETEAIRDWARSEGIAVSNSGRLPGGLREKWEAAGSPGLENVQS